MLRAKQKPSANIRHSTTKISTLQKTKICSTQNNTQNFRTAVFTGFFEWLAASWVNATIWNSWIEVGIVKKIRLKALY